MRLLLIPLFAIPTILQGQSLALRPLPSPLFHVEATPVHAGTLTAPESGLSRDPREVWTGLGLMLGLATVWGLSHEIQETDCADAATCGHWSPGPRGYLVGAAAGALTGRLVGGVIYRKQGAERFAVDSTPVSHGKIGRGMAIGALTGAGIGILLGGMAANRGCSCDDPGLEVPAGGILGAVVGLVVGGSLADDRPRP